MSKIDELEDRKLQNRELWIYLLPVVGVIPSLWTLSRDRANTEQKKASRLSIMLLLLWILAYISLFMGADRASEILAFRLLYTNALLTTGYFLICIGLMFRLQQGKKPYFLLTNFTIKTNKNS